MKKLISFFVCMLMVVSSATGAVSIFADDVRTTENVLIDENFSSFAYGSVPSDAFDIKRAGGGDMAVVNEPDAMNRSLRMSCTNGGSVYIEKGISNPEAAPLNLSFRFKTENSSSFCLVFMKDSFGNSASVFEIKDGMLSDMKIEPDRWYYAEITFNVSSQTYGVSVDGKKIIKKNEIPFADFAYVRFGLSDCSQEINIDDIRLIRADISSSDSEYFKMNDLYISPVEQGEVNDIVSDAFLMYKGSERAWKNRTALESKNVPFEKDGNLYLPVRFAAENIGAEVVWNNVEQKTFIVFADNTYKLTSGESKVCANGSPLELTAPVINKEGSMYMASADIAKLLDCSVYTDGGLVMLGGDGELMNIADDRVKSEIVNMTKYQRPGGEELYGAIVERFGSAHPRVHGNSSDFERIRQLVATDNLASKMFEKLKKEADKILEKPVSEYPEGERKDFDDELGPVRDHLDTWPRLLSFVYNITGDARYAERAWQELEAGCSFPNWNHEITFLDTAHILHGMAISYDWLYNYLSPYPERLSFIENAIMEKGVRPALKAYRGEYNYTNSFSGVYFWTTDEYNWNPACNMAVLAACTALAEKYPEECTAALKYIIRSLEFHFNEFEPDGAWSEGPDYGYVTVNMDAQVISMIESAFGTDYGISSVPGLIESAYFHQYILGPTGFFNYSDGNKQTNPVYSFSFLYASHLNDTALGFYRNKSLQKSNYDCTVEEMFWYDPALVGTSASNLDNDKYFRKAETAVMRSSWDEDAVFAGFHAHDNGAPHGHLDAGTFVLDSFGTEWFREIGYDPLSYTSEGTNFTTYRARAEGHNTLVIDDTPYSEPESDENGMVRFMDYNFDELSVGENPPFESVIERGTGTVDVSQDPTDKNNRYITISNSEASPASQVFYQHQFPEPYVNTGISYEFKIKFKDLNWVSETHGSQWKFPEIKGTEGGINFPFYLTQHGFGIVRAEGWHSLLSPAKPDIWYTMKFNINLKDNTYSVSVDGGKEGGSGALQNLPLEKSMGNLHYIRPTFDMAATTWYVDDISIRLNSADSALTVNSARAFDQSRKAKTEIERFESTQSGAIAVSDLTEAYAAWADSAKRGVMLCDQRRAFVVRDEVKLKGKSDVYWFGHMTSSTNVKISEDKKSAILKKNGQRLWVGIISDTDAGFEMMKANPLPGSPDPAGQSANVEYKKLAIKLTGTEEVNLTVAMIPLMAGEDVPRNIPEDIAIENWTLSDKELPKASAITVNGELLGNFEPSTYVYDILLPEETPTAPVVEAASSEGSVSITQAQKAPGYAVVTIDNGIDKCEYIVSFRTPEIITSTIQGYKVTEKNITYSEQENATNCAAASIDDNLDTRWVSEGEGEWIMYDLSQSAQLGKLDIAWYYGDSRNYSFEIQLSDDAQSWTSVYKGQSSGTTADFETYEFGSVYNARYIKIICNGHASGSWNNIAEVR